MRYLLLPVLVISAALAGPATAAPPTVVPLTLSLGANDGTETDIFPGTPLTLTATLENGPALEASTARAALAQAKASLDAAVADGEVSREDADASLAGKVAPPDAPPITVRALKARFRFAAPDGTALPWTPRLLDEKDEATVLDGERTAEVTFVVPPEQTASLQPGQLRLILHYDARGAAEGEWAGEAASAEVLVRVAVRPAALTPEQTWTEARALSWYHLAIGDWQAALADAQAMVQAVPSEPGGYAQLAHARAGKGDQAGALAAYQDAILHAVALDPDGEPPFVMMLAADRLRQALGVKPHDGPAVAAAPEGAAPPAPGIPSPTPAPAAATPPPPAPAAPATVPATPVPPPAPAPSSAQPYNSQDPDAQRQWATEATASSQYSTQGGAARQATGPPDCPRYADCSSAWYPTPSDDGIQWLELTYPYPMVPRRIEVHENFCAGAVTRVLTLPEGADSKAWQVWLDRRAPEVPAAPAAPVVTSVEVRADARPTRRVRVEVDTAVPGWNEIDAVALVGRYVTGVPDASAGTFRWWAEAASASSQYGTKNYAAGQVVGPPEIGPPGDRPTAWAPGSKDGGLEWLEVTYPAPLVPAQLNIYESCGPGGGVRVEAREEATGRWVTLWEGKDPTAPPAGVFSPALTANTFAARVFRIHLDTSVPGWNEIDAVELVGSPPASR